MTTNAGRRGEKSKGRPSASRRLIAGLRISRQDEQLLDVVRPFLSEAASEGELAYRLWRRGLEITLAEVAGLGEPLPSCTTEPLIASLVAQRLLLSIPLLRRTGKLILLGIDLVPTDGGSQDRFTKPLHAPTTETIDERASEAIIDLGGSDFL